MEKEFSKTIQELLRFYTEKDSYAFSALCVSLFKAGVCEELTASFCGSIRRMNIDHLHILGDIYDRGISPQRVMDLLDRFGRFDIQWGNHDIVWLGAASGSEVCCANVVRVALRYGNMNVLEKGYGINLLPLMSLAEGYYDESRLEAFMPRFSEEDLDISEIALAKMHKAISIIQFKLESALYERNPAYGMNHRDLLSQIDFSGQRISLEGKTYAIDVKDFPTVDPSSPKELLAAEKVALEALSASFAASEKLKRHAALLVSKGNLYKVYNGNLLFHACIPVEESGEFKKVSWDNEHTYSAKALMDAFEKEIKKSCLDETKSKDFFWYAWAGQDSPLFGKDKMATFERYFIDEKETHKETYCPYFSLQDDVRFAEKVLKEFGLDPIRSKIINGHVPTCYSGEENYIKANGKVILIDGGFSSAYRKITKSAGVTLKYNSYGMSLIVHSPFFSINHAIETESDITSEKRFLPKSDKIIRIKDTDAGKEIKEEIYYLRLLLEAYREGALPALE